MRMDHDPFPRTPEGFHSCVEATLMGLKTEDTAFMRARRIRWVALAAALLALALGTAVAVVQGNALRTHMAAGGGQLAAQVQDIHINAAAEGFSFTVEEVLMEGDALYLSCSVCVPEDGRTYLFSPCDIRMDGVPVRCASGLDAEFFANLYAIGGSYGTSATQVMQLKLDHPPETASVLECACVFMLAEKPLQRMDAKALDALLTEPDADGCADQLMKNADVLCYFETSVEGDPVPVVYLHYYPEIRAIYEEKGEDLLNAEDIERAGIAKRLCTLALSLPMQDAGREAQLRNDVVQRIWFMDGYSIEIRRLHLSHFEAEFEAIIRSDDDAFEVWSEDQPFGQYYSLCNADGTDFGRVDYRLMSGDAVRLENGRMAYLVSSSMGGVFPVDGLNEIWLAPGDFGERDMSRAIRLIPICNPEAKASEAEWPEDDPADADDLSS